MIRTVLVGMWLLIGGISFAYTFTPAAAQTNVTDEPTVHMFGRDDCGFCQKQFAWLEAEGISYTYHNITENEVANTQFKAVAAKHNTSLAPSLLVFA